MSEYPGMPLGNDEIVIQIEALTEEPRVSEKPGHIAERDQVYCTRLLGRHSVNLEQNHCMSARQQSIVTGS